MSHSWYEEADIVSKNHDMKREDALAKRAVREATRLTRRVVRAEEHSARRAERRARYSGALAVAKRVAPSLFVEAADEKFDGGDINSLITMGSKGTSTVMQRLQLRAERLGFAARGLALRDTPDEVDTKLIAIVSSLMPELHKPAISNAASFTWLTRHGLEHTAQVPHLQRGQLDPLSLRAAEALIAREGNNPVGLIGDDGITTGIAMPTRFEGTIAVITEAQTHDGSASATIALASYR